MILISSWSSILSINRAFVKLKLARSALLESSTWFLNGERSGPGFRR